MKTIKLLLLLIGICCVLFLLYTTGMLNPIFRRSETAKNVAKTIDYTVRDASIPDLKKLFKSHEKKVSSQMTGTGTVVRVLRDDTDGVKHQLFFLKLETGQIILIAHNLNVSERLMNLKQGDTVAFCGEYAWNKNGGIVFRTHKSTDKIHPDGWLKYKNKEYK